MSLSLTDVERQARMLSPDERARLAEVLPTPSFFFLPEGHVNLLC
jgi:hypothetical protein